MSIKQQVQDDLKEAMKTRQEVKIGALRMLLTAFVNKEKEKGEEISDEQFAQVVMSEAKKRRESIEAFGKGGRQDLVQKEEAELEILQAYLPAQLSEEEIRELAKKTIADVGASSLKDMGKVMANLMSKLAGKADGAVVSAIVKELLSQSTTQ